MSMGRSETAGSRSGGYRFGSFEEFEEAVVNLVRWPEDEGGGRQWKIRCRKIEVTVDPRYGRCITITGLGGGMPYSIYENLPETEQDENRRRYHWEHFRDASVLLEMLVTHSDTIFGGPMELIMNWLAKYSESIIAENKYQPR